MSEAAYRLMVDITAKIEILYCSLEGTFSIYDGRKEQAKSRLKSSYRVYVVCDVCCNMETSIYGWLHAPCACALNSRVWAFGDDRNLHFSGVNFFCMKSVCGWP